MMQVTVRAAGALATQAGPGRLARTSTITGWTDGLITGRKHYGKAAGELGIAPEARPRAIRATKK